NEGRRVINNVQRVATLFLTKTIFSIILVIIALLTRGRYPITPSQLFMIDFLVIGLPSFVLSLQPNHEQVKGKFLSNVLSKALPGALTVGVQTLIIMWLARPNILNLTTEARSTLIVISATFTSFIVLYRVLKPFNALKRILFVTMFIIFVVAVIFLPEFFEFNAISKYYLRLSGSDVITEMLPLPALLLLIVMLQSSSVLISFFIKLPGWIKKGFKGAIMKLSGV
ncbi:MAG: hypothetical protein GX931_01155, partial [Acholeplasmataceae bacterium]|nr:hypothetical protein [Acholeplasmataceae bacterium]